MAQGSTVPDVPYVRVTLEALMALHGSTWSLKLIHSFLHRAPSLGLRQGGASSLRRREAKSDACRSAFINRGHSSCVWCLATYEDIALGLEMILVF